MDRANKLFGECLGGKTERIGEFVRFVFEKTDLSVFVKIGKPEGMCGVLVDDATFARAQAEPNSVFAKEFVTLELRHASKL